MFTGLIEDVGRVEEAEPSSAGRSLRIASAADAALRPGDSIAVNGVCLTAFDCTAAGFRAELSPETLRATTLGGLMPGHRVNLERPLRADARLGGHFVLGHVDGVGHVRVVIPQGECRWIEIELPPALAPYVIPKGSIAIDGVSLTVAALAPGRISVQLIPFTLAHTALADLRVGDPVNLEGDVLGKYVVRLLSERGDLAVPIAGTGGSPS